MTAALWFTYDLGDERMICGALCVTVTGDRCIITELAEKNQNTVIVFL